MGSICGRQKGRAELTGADMRATFTAIIFISLFFFSSVQAQDRSGGWEWAISAVYQDSKDLGSAGGSTLNIDEGIGIGFNLSYYFNHKLSLGFDFDYLEPDYRATLIEDAVPPSTTVIDHEFTQLNGRFKATFNFIDAPFTPFLEVGAGWTYIDSNVADGPPITGCWWHPYWGYICDSYYSTYTQTSFTYGVGVGLRYDIAGGSFIKASVNQWELDNVGSTEDAFLAGARIEFGWGF